MSDGATCTVWFQMVMLYDSVRWCSIVQDSARWFYMMHNCARWFRIVKDGTRWCRSVQDNVRWWTYGPARREIMQGGARWYSIMQIVPDGAR